MTALDSKKSTDYQALMKNALLEIRDLKRRLQAVESEKTEPLAIIGMGCRFPGGADHPQAFWNLLKNGWDAITEIPEERSYIREYYNYGGFLKNLEQFDAKFFKMTPKEASNLDPKQRLLLEVCWETLANAEIAPESLFGSNTGVFIGIGDCDYPIISVQNSDNFNINAYFATGWALCVASGRLSYLLGLKGPSLSIDTACSSSLTALYMACQSLRHQESQMAIVGGVNTLLSAEMFSNFAQANMLSPVGRCKTFDAAADGYVRGEGCGIIIIKRLSDALADKNHIWALIRGSAVNQDGASGGLTVPSGPAQEAVIRQALKNSGIEPDQVSYIEAHGTGTSLGDPIEITALGNVFCQNSRKNPLIIGSVKTNIGHLEATAGMAGLIKLVLCLQHQKIPPQLHFKTPNPLIDWKNLSVTIPTSLTSWRSENQTRIAGLSSFGFSGTNVHVVLEEFLPRSHAGAWEREEKPKMICFQRQNYPVPRPDVKEKKENKQPDIHPLLGHRINSPLADVVFEAEIGCQSPSLLNHHRIYGTAIVPAAAFLEMSLAAGKAVWSSEKICLNDVHIHQALILPEKTHTIVQTILKSNGSAKYEFKIYSLSSDNTWNHHVSGLLEKHDKTNEKEKIDEIAFNTGDPVSISALYRNFEALGIYYGVDFQGIKQIYKDGECIVGVIELSEKLFWESGSYLFHPALLDSCFQLAQPLFSENTLRVPTGLKRFQVYRKPQAVLRCEVRLEMLQNTLNLIIVDKNEEIIAKIEALSSKEISRESLLKISEPQINDFLYQLQWLPKPLKTTSENQNKNWIVFSAVEELKESSSRNFGDINVKIISISDVTEVLKPLQELIRNTSHDFPHLCFMTRGVQSSTTQPCQAPLWGLAQTIRKEYPEIQCLCMDLDTLPNDNEIQSISEELKFFDNEIGVMFRQGLRHVPRLSKYQLESVSAPFRLSISDYGILENVKLIPLKRQKLESDEIEIEVMSAGLNFRDVLIALGMMKLEQSETPQFGFECAGKVVSVGKNVSSFKIGDEVMAAPVLGTLASFVAVKSALATLKPKDLNFEQAATIPLVFLTAYYALHHLAKIKATDRILIHAAAGGVGLAAIQLAQQAGAEIIATASPGKWEFLKSLGITHILNSRNTEFARALENEKVDIVLNSLTGEFIPKSLDVLNTGGRFVEIGKIGIWEEKQVHEKRPDIAYFSFDLGDISRQNPDLISAMFQKISQEFEKGGFSPIHHQVFSIHKAAQAFRYMAQAKHIGKIVISFQDIQPIRPDADYLITGGLGALGLKTAEWMVAEGARNLILMGRKPPSDEASHIIQNLNHKGANIRIEQRDIGGESHVKAVIDNAPSLKGIIHAAGVVDDAMIPEQSAERFKKVMNPKVLGAWNLHCLTKNMELDFFVMFSSAASMLGNPGQSNYAAANAFLDALAHFRHHQGLPAVSINWGPWANIGMASLQTNRGTRLERQGIRSIKPQAGLSVLKKILIEKPVQLAVMDMNWHEYISNSPVQAAFLSNLVQAEIKQSTGFIEKIKNLPIEQTSRALLDQIQDQAGKVMGYESSHQVDIHMPLMEQGFDSLMSVELRNRLSQIIGKTLPVTLLFDYPTLEKIRDFILNEVFEVGKSQQVKKEVANSLQLPIVPTIKHEKNEESAEAILNEIENLIK